MPQAARVHVLAGPARSGKTRALLDRYRQALREEPIGSALWLAPHRRAADEVRTGLLDGGLTACFAPQVHTFIQFAEAILALSPTAVRPISRLLTRQMVREVVDQLIAEGGLRHFNSIAHTAGLIDMLCGFVAELKRLEIWPLEFRRACEARGCTEKDRELVTIYERYQQTLLEHNLYDAEGRFWSARERLRDGQLRPFERVKLVIVDGFTDFTRTQHEILEVLAQRVEEMHVGLPCDEPPGQRADLFAKATTTLDELRRRHTRVEVEHQPRVADGAWPAIEHLERELFQNPRHGRTTDDTTGVEILAASGQLGEIELLAGRIKRLLTAGDDGRAVRPSEIVVAFRSLSDSAPLVREVFEERGIPVACEAGRPMSRIPVLRALMGLLRLMAEDWPFRQLLSVLGSSYVRPACRTDVAAMHAEEVIRRLQYPSGRAALLGTVARWAQPRDESVDDSEPNERLQAREQRRQIAADALPLLEGLAEILDRLPRRATSSEWMTALAALADNIQLLPADDATDDVSRIDRQAWKRLLAALEANDRLAHWTARTPRQYTQRELLEFLVDYLHTEELPADVEEHGRIRVLAAASVRGLHVPYLFFAGLSEKAMPVPERADRLYSERELRTLNEQGLTLPNRADFSSAEMLLFYEVLTASTRRLTLSYPALDESAQPLSPSPYVEEVERAVGKKLRHSEPDLSPIPRDLEPFGAVEWRIRAVADALNGEYGLLAGLLQASDGLTNNLLHSLEVMNHRRTEGFGAYEGVVLGDAARGLLAQQYGPDRKWSASQLEQYARCPHQFFLQRVLGIRELDELGLATDFLTRGQLLHDTLARLHRDWNAQHARNASPCEGVAEAFGQLYADTVQGLVEAMRTDNPLMPALREIDRRVLVEWGSLYYEQHSVYDAAWGDCDHPLRPAHFEVSFGEEVADPRFDPISTAEPYVLRRHGETIRIVGRIDRIDIGQAGGREVFNILDYKSGGAAKLDEESIQRGTAMQLPLYAIVAQELLLATREATPWRVNYWFVKKEGYKDKAALRLHEADGSELRPTPSWQQLREAVLDRVVSLVRGIREGQFPMASVDEECTSRCEYRTVCRVGQVRALEKTWQPPPVPAPQPG